MAARKGKARESDEAASKRVQSEFPKLTLEQALRVPQALIDANGGRPLPPIDTASALDISPGSSDFRALLSSALKYGLSQGSYKSDRISLESLGREIVEPTSGSSRTSALARAALTPVTFRRMYEHFRGKKLPDPQFFENTVVREFAVPREHAKVCVQVFQSNMDFIGLMRTTKSGRWLSTEPAPNGAVAGADGVAHDLLETAASDEGEPTARGRDVMGPDLPPAHAASHVQASEDARKKKVFITHGKDKSLLEPIRKLLRFGEMEPIISVEKQSVSQAVPDKVLNEMRMCGAAIIHVDAEQRLVGADSKEHVVLNPNVLIEIGAAMALYGRRFILLVRDGLKLPSNLQGLYEVRYNGDGLDGTATIRLLEAINELKSLAPLTAAAE